MFPINSFSMESAPGAETVINGRKCVYFGGTGYFGLHGHPSVIRAGMTAFRKFGTHSATTRLGFGNNPALLAVEKKLAEYFGKGDAVYFGSGYLSSLFLTQGLAGKYDIIFADELSHFSIKDALPAAGKPAVFFSHRDPRDLSKKLKRSLKPRSVPLVISDGVFPAFGKIAPVPEYIKVLEPYQGIIALDDAHGVGVLGPNGRGTYEHFGLKGSRLFLAGTLSKAFGGHGGFIPVAQKSADRIRKMVGAYRGSTPTPTPIAAASAKAVEILMKHPEMRQKLWGNVALAKRGMKELGLEADGTPVPIITWSLKSEKEMRRLQEALMSRGIALAHLKYTGCPAGGVLRATIFSTHTQAHVRLLLDELRRLL